MPDLAGIVRGVRRFEPPAGHLTDLLTTAPRRLTGKLMLEISFIVDEPRGGR